MSLAGHRGASRLATQTVVPLPSLDQQKIVVDKLDEIAGGKNQLSDVYRQKLISLTELKQSLLQKAFFGQLTADKEVSDAIHNKEEVA
jgi:type I restriction enzyme S subunit